LSGLVRERFNISERPLPAKAKTARPPGTRRCNKFISKTGSTESALAAIDEKAEDKVQRKGKNAEPGRYYDEHIGYEDNSGDEDDDSDGSESFLSRTYSQEETSCLEGEDDEGTYFTNNYTEGEYTDVNHGLSTDDYSLSSNHPTHTFSSEADSRELSLHSFRILFSSTNGIASSHQRQYGGSSKVEHWPIPSHARFVFSEHPTFCARKKNDHTTYQPQVIPPKISFPHSLYQHQNDCFYV
jgi:hypothetical protein